MKLTNQFGFVTFWFLELQTTMNITKTRDFIRTLHNVKRVEILPYHGLGIIKYKEMNIDYPLKDLESPTKERVENAKKILECDKYTDY